MLGKLLFLIKVIPAEVNVSVTEVTNELVAGSLNITHDSTFKDSNEGNDLNKSSSGDGVRSDQSGNTVGVRVEGVTRVVNVSGKMDSGTGHNLSKERKLTDTSVLKLDVTKTVETFLVSTVQKSKRIPASKRGLSTKFFFEGLDGSGRLTNLSGGKGD